MFTYIDRAVRNKLISQGSLIRIDAEGQPTDPNTPPQPGSKAISILGPIPLPLEYHGRHFDAKWYASVRHTELNKVQSLADDLRGRDAQASFSALASSMEKVKAPEPPRVSTITS